MLFQGFYASNRLIHGFIGWNQVSCLSNQFIDRYCQPSIVQNRVRLGLVEGNNVQLSWYPRMCLLVFFTSPALRFTLGYCKLILMNFILHIMLLIVTNRTLLVVLNVVSKTWIGQKQLTLRCFRSQCTQFCKTISHFGCYLLTQ